MNAQQVLESYVTHFCSLFRTIGFGAEAHAVGCLVQLSFLLKQSAVSLRAGIGALNTGVGLLNRHWTVT